MSYIAPDFRYNNKKDRILTFLYKVNVKKDKQTGIQAKETVKEIDKYYMQVNIDNSYQAESRKISENYKQLILATYDDGTVLYLDEKGEMRKGE